jgi:hypothetical protein
MEFGERIKNLIKRMAHGEKFNAEEEIGYLRNAKNLLEEPRVVEIDDDDDIFGPTTTAETPEKTINNATVVTKESELPSTEVKVSEIEPTVVTLNDDDANGTINN